MANTCGVSLLEHWLLQYSLDDGTNASKLRATPQNPLKTPHRWIRLYLFATLASACAAYRELLSLPAGY
jgi:hypothetical protein